MYQVDSSFKQVSRLDWLELSDDCRMVIVGRVEATMTAAHWHSLPMGKSSRSHDDSGPMGFLPMSKSSGGTMIVAQWHSLSMGKLSAANKLQIIRTEDLDD